MKRKSSVLLSSGIFPICKASGEKRVRCFAGQHAIPNSFLLYCFNTRRLILCLIVRTDHHIQDELIKLFAHSHLRRIAGDLKAAGYFALEEDEVTDSSNKEQVVVCLRRVDDKFEAHEDFVGFHKLALLWMMAGQNWHFL